MNQRAVFLDKDGTLIEDVPYNVDPDRMRLAAGAADGASSACEGRLPADRDLESVRCCPRSLLRRGTEAVAQRLHELAGGPSA